jgi:hypothetical protein
MGFLLQILVRHDCAASAAQASALSTGVAHPVGLVAAISDIILFVRGSFCCNLPFGRDISGYQHQVLCPFLMYQILIMMAVGTAPLLATYALYRHVSPAGIDGIRCSIHRLSYVSGACICHA